jgi:DNA helicase HerA-like ATPase
MELAMAITTNGKFYLGRIFEPIQGKVIDCPVLYDPADLTTHAVVVGMTGSGKTGLCIDILEEAALNGIPALLIDPKGDITNLLLHFPDLAPQDFQPWVNPDEARRVGKSIDL